MAAPNQVPSDPTYASYNALVPEQRDMEQAPDQLIGHTISTAFIGTNKEYADSYQLKISTYDSAILALCFVEDSGTRNGWHTTSGGTSLTLQEDPSFRSICEVGFQCFFAWFLHFSVVGAQFLLVFLLYATVVEESEGPYEQGLHAFTGRLQNAVAEHSTIGKDHDIMKLCRKDHTLAGSHIAVVVIWICRMLKELRNAFQVALIVFSMPNASNSIDDLCEKDEVGEVTKECYKIVQMNTFLKATIIIFVCGVRLIAAAFLTFTTSKYLILTGNMANVILKTISMQFIVQLDGLCLQAFGAPTYLKKIQASKLQYKVTRSTLLVQWSFSMLSVIGVIAVALSLNHIMFSNIDGFRLACRNYYYAFPHERHIPTDFYLAMKEAFGEACAFGLRRSEEALNVPQK